MNNSKLRRLADRQSKRNNSDEKAAIKPSEDKMIPFEFDGNDYFLALRDNALVFDSAMTLLYTIDYDMLSTSSTPLFCKVNEIKETVMLSDPSQELVRLGVRRGGALDSIYFTSKFDAVFIFKKLKRVAMRNGEDIEELIIEKDGVIIESFTPSPKRRAGRLFRNNRELEDSENIEFISTMTRVEDILESVISSKMNNMSADVNTESIDKCIELLKRAKEQL